MLRPLQFVLPPPVGDAWVLWCCKLKKNAIVLWDRLLLFLEYLGNGYDVIFGVISMNRCQLIPWNILHLSSAPSPPVDVG